MIINAANIKLGTQHQLQKQTQNTEALHVWRAPPPQAQPPAHAAVHDRLSLSEAVKAPAVQSQKVDPEKSLNPLQGISFQIIRRMVMEITGRDFQLFSPDQLQGDVQQIDAQVPQQPPAAQSSAELAGNGSDGFGLVYQRSSSYYESESLQFSAEGSIVTRDGQSINFSVSLNMSREFYLETNQEIRLGDAAKKTDPLVVNFDGNAAELTSTTFSFDIDVNGSLDQIAILKGNSGMLALDKNQDGKINDGSELFGPASGDGFKELAAYDEDGNQFIDAGDSIYNKLRIWQRHADGSQQLVALGERNIGAIFLGHVTTPFQLKNAENQLQGEVASSGIYVTEEGKTGTVQQINFAA